MATITVGDSTTLRDKVVVVTGRRAGMGRVPALRFC